MSANGFGEATVRLDDGVVPTNWPASGIHGFRIVLTYELRGYWRRAIRSSRVM